MSLIAKLKADQLEARKSRDTVAATLLTTLLGEASMVTEDEFKAAEAVALKAESVEDRDARRASGDGFVVPPIPVTVPITDEKVIATITKFLKGAKSNAELLEKEFERAMGHPSTDGKTRLLEDGQREFMANIVPKMRATDREIEILTSYLPKQMTEDELREAVSTFKAANPDANMGVIMAHLKTNFAGLYDGKMASQIAKG
jgi:hypothetical protein